MQHDLPIFISIDGSIDENGYAFSTIFIVAPDIRNTDMMGILEWQNRLAKILLIRSGNYQNTGVRVLHCMN
jgi:hypothetical protein